MLPEDPNQPENNTLSETQPASESQQNLSAEVSGTPESPALPVPPAPPIANATESSSSPQMTPTPFRVPHTGRDPKRMILMIGGGSVLLIALVVFSSFVMIAYGSLKVGSPKFRSAVEQFIVSLPFMPKTPAFVLNQSLKAQPKKFVLDLSMAASNKSFAPYFSNGQIDLAVTGPVDLTDLKKPELSLNLKLTKQLNADVTVKKQIVYFRLNEFPPVFAIALSSFGFPSEMQKKFVKQWFYYDAETLDTEASKNLADQKKDQKSLDQEITDKLTNVMITYKDKIKTTMASDSVDKIATHKITLILNKEVIDALEKAGYTQSDTDYKEFKPTTSQSIQQITMTYWIDKKEYYVRKLSASFTIKQPKSGNAKFTSIKSTNRFAQGMDMLPYMPQPDQEIPVSFVMKFGKINEPQKITAPAGAMRFEDFIQKLVESQSSSSGSGIFAQQFEQSNNSRRRADISRLLNAIDLYMVDHKGEPPTGLSSTSKSISKDGANLCQALVPQYIGSLPVDPNINTGRPIAQKDCASSYFTGYTIQFDSTKKIIIINAPYAELGESISGSR